MDDYTVPGARRQSGVWAAGMALLLALPGLALSRPIVAITAPPEQASVAGETWITAAFRSDSARNIVRLELSLDAQLIQEYLLPTPLLEGRKSFAVDMSARAAGAHTFTVRALDAAGESGQAQRVVSVASGAGARPAEDRIPPVVSIFYPAQGAVLTGRVVIRADAGDNVGVRNVIFLVDGKLHTILINRPPFTANWDTTGLTDGPHVLEARAKDAADNEGFSAPVTVIVQNHGAPAAPVGPEAYSPAPVRPSGPPGTFVASPYPDTSVAPPGPVVIEPTLPGSGASGTALPGSALGPGAVEPAKAPPIPAAGYLGPVGPGAVTPGGMAVTPPIPDGTVEPENPTPAETVVSVPSPRRPGAPAQELAVPVIRAALDLPAPGITVPPSTVPATAPQPEPVAPQPEPETPPPTPVVEPEAPAAPSGPAVSGTPELVAPAVSSAPREPLAAPPAGEPETAASELATGPVAVQPAYPAITEAPPDLYHRGPSLAPPGATAGTSPIAPPDEATPVATVDKPVEKPGPSPASPVDNPTMPTVSVEKPVENRGTSVENPAGPSDPEPGRRRSGLRRLKPGEPVPTAEGSGAAAPSEMAAPADEGLAAPSTGGRREITPADAAALALAQVVFRGKVLGDAARPEVAEGTVMVSLKHIFEAVDGALYWFSAEKRARAVAANADLAVQIGTTRATLNAESLELQTAPVLKNSRIMVPLSLVSRALGLKFELDPAAHQVTISAR